MSEHSFNEVHRLRSVDDDCEGAENLNLIVEDSVLENDGGEGAGELDAT